MAFALGEQGDEHVGAGDLLAAGILHVDDRALDHPLEARRRLGVLLVLDDQARQLLVDILGERRAKLLHVDVAGAHHRAGVLVVAQRKEQMLQRGVLVAAFIGGRKRAVEAFLESGRK